VQLGPGFHGWCCTALADDRLSIQMPLMPGRMTYQFAYHLPDVDGKVGLLLTNTVKTDRVSIFVPDDGSAAQTTLVRAGPTDRSGPAALRMFQADNVPAGQAVGVVLAQVSVEAPAATQAKTGVSTKVWAGAAAGIVVVAGIGLVLFRRRSSSQLV
jgi:LPXTG-motif cell wall-anchored protein